MEIDACNIYNSFYRITLRKFMEILQQTFSGLYDSPLLTSIIYLSSGKAHKVVTKIMEILWKSCVFKI